MLRFCAPCAFFPPFYLEIGPTGVILPTLITTDLKFSCNRGVLLDLLNFGKLVVAPTLVINKTK